MRLRVNRPVNVFLCVGISVFGVTHPAIAAENSDFMKCGQLFTKSERLECYDAVYSARIRGVAPPPNEPASATSSVVVSPPAQTTAPPATDVAAAESKFGFPQPAEEGLQEIRSPVKKVAVNNQKKRLVFYLENGQVWEQAEGRQFVVPDEPVVAVITPGMWSSYHLSFEGRKQWVKVKRIK